jgi:hypothetical protein
LLSSICFVSSSLSIVWVAGVDVILGCHVYALLAWSYVPCFWIFVFTSS